MQLYCDQAAAAIPDPEVMDFYSGVWKIAYANQESIHHLGYELRSALEEAGRDLVSGLTGGDDFLCCWCNSGTGAFMLMERILSGSRSPAAVSVLEHPALPAMLKRVVPEVTVIGCGPDGKLTGPLPENSNIFIHAVQSELGTIQDVPELFKSSGRGGWRFCDAVQMAGRLPMQETARNSDMLAVSGIKFGAPGGGALLIRRSLPGIKQILEKIKLSRHPEYTAERVNVPAALTMAYAARMRVEKMADDLERISRINRQLRETLTGQDIIATVPFEKASPYILHLQLPEKQGAVVVRQLAERNIAIGSGSACAAESASGSPALLALGLKKKAAFSGIRLSFGFDFSETQAEFLAENLLSVLKNY